MLHSQLVPLVMDCLTKKLHTFTMQAPIVVKGNIYDDVHVITLVIHGQLEGEIPLIAVIWPTIAGNQYSSISTLYVSTILYHLCSIPIPLTNLSIIQVYNRIFDSLPLVSIISSSSVYSAHHFGRLVTFRPITPNGSFSLRSGFAAWKFSWSTRVI